jgi:uncharacterized membrane protein
MPAAHPRQKGERSGLHARELREESIVSVIKRALAAAVLLSLAMGSQAALGAAPSTTTARPGPAIANVGSRLDTPAPAAQSPHGPPSALPWHAIDANTYAQAKADAARRASGIQSYRRNDFSIRADPASQTVVPGQSTTYTVSTQTTTGSPETMSLSVSGLPSGTTASFNPPSIPAGQSSVLTVATTAATPGGTFTLTITGTYKSPPTSHSTMVTLVVNAPVVDDFSISASPASQSVVQGASATYTVSTAVTSGNAQTVNLSVAGVPSGATATFTPPSVTAGGSSTLTIATTSSTATGTFTLTITGTGTTAAHSTTVTLVVSGPVVDDFSISASPASQSVVQSSSATYTVSTAVTSGNAQTVSLSVSGLPSGATGSFNPASVTAGGSSTLTVTTTSTTSTGTFTLTITGAGASATHSTTVGLTVSAPSSGPTLGPSWLGQSQNNLAPPDPTGAIGPSSYIELINLRYGI